MIRFCSSIWTYSKLHSHFCPVDSSFKRQQCCYSRHWTRNELLPRLCGVSSGTFPRYPKCNIPISSLASGDITFFTSCPTTLWVEETIVRFFSSVQTVWDTELQSILQMGFDSIPTINNLGPNGNDSYLEHFAISPSLAPYICFDNDNDSLHYLAGPSKLEL